MLSRGLQEFRQAIYNNLRKAQDATFELMDALLLTRTAQSLADLSLSCVFRRQWPSVYEALQDTRPDRQQLMKLYIQQLPRSERILLAGDHTRKVETVRQNTERTCLRTFPITTVREPGDCRIRLQYIGVNLRNLGCDHTSNFVTRSNDDNSPHAAGLKSEKVSPVCRIGSQLYESKTSSESGKSRPASSHASTRT